MLTTKMRQDAKHERDGWVSFFRQDAPKDGSEVDLVDVDSLKFQSSMRWDQTSEMWMKKVGEKVTAWLPGLNGARRPTHWKLSEGKKR